MEKVLRHVWHLEKQLERQNEKMSDQTVDTRITPMWDKTIFVQVGAPKLEKEIRKWASTHQLDVVVGNPEDPDLIACPSFAVVLDRSLIVENGMYSLYLDHVNDDSDSELSKVMRSFSICILVDDIKDLELPMLDVVLQVDLNQKNAIKFILHNLELASKLVAGTSVKHLKAAEKAVDKYLK
jgi:hypothetical protein